VEAPARRPSKNAAVRRVRVILVTIARARVRQARLSPSLGCRVSNRRGGPRQTYPCRAHFCSPTTVKRGDPSYREVEFLGFNVIAGLHPFSHIIDSIPDATPHPQILGALPRRSVFLERLNREAGELDTRKNLSGFGIL